jgi:hypothetical protein
MAATATPVVIDPTTWTVCAVCAAVPNPLVATYIYFFPMLIRSTPKISKPPISNVELDIVLRLVPETEIPADCLRIAPFALTTVPGWMALISARVMPDFINWVAKLAHCAEFVADVPAGAV